MEWAVGQQYSVSPEIAKKVVLKGFQALADEGFD